VTVLANTPVGVLHKGDTIWWQRRDGTMANATVTDRSATTPSVVFTRTPRGKARCVPIDQIRRIQSAPGALVRHDTG
jgi:hypothetical protein